MLLTASPVDIRVLRGRGQPFLVEGGGLIAGTLQIKLTNRSNSAASYTVRVAKPQSGEVHLDENPVTVSSGELRTLNGTLHLRADAFGPLGTCPVQIEVTGPNGFTRLVSYTALGPATKGGTQ